MANATESLLKENRKFAPPPEFAKKALWNDKTAYQTLLTQSHKNPIAFWEENANRLLWRKPWKQVLEWNAPWAKWFVGGELNVSENCLDRHLANQAKKKAIIWEGEDGSTETWTYEELHQAVCQLANTLTHTFHLKPKDTVAIYMPMIPQAVIAMLACARIGVIHSVVFGGFSSHSLRDRINDAKSRMVITSDFSFRRGQNLDLLSIVNEAVKETPSIESVLVWKRKEKSWNSPVSEQPKNHAPAHIDRPQ